MSEMRNAAVRSVRIHMVLYCCGVWKKTTEVVSTTKDHEICKKIYPSSFFLIEYGYSAAWFASAVRSLGCLKHSVVLPSGHPALGVSAKSSSFIQAGLLCSQEDFTISQWMPQRPLVCKAGLALLSFTPNIISTGGISFSLAKLSSIKHNRVPGVAPTLSLRSSEDSFLR